MSDLAQDLASTYRQLVAAGELVDLGAVSAVLAQQPFCRVALSRAAAFQVLGQGAALFSPAGLGRTVTVLRACRTALGQGASEVVFEVGFFRQSSGRLRWRSISLRAFFCVDGAFPTLLITLGEAT
jgi:hypothetical protein